MVEPKAGNQQRQSSDDAAMSLQPFITKLGHELQEIRVRALKTILFKLEHKLICAADLVQERELLIRLLEWFNYPQSPMKKDVLGLVENLAKHVSAAEILLNVGAVEFFSQLRQDIDPELYQSVDNVTHQLLSIPQSSSGMHSDWCLYKPQDEHNRKQVGGDEQFKSLSYNVLSTVQNPTNTLTSYSAPVLLGKPVGYFEESTANVVPTSSTPSSVESASRSHDSFSTSGTLTYFQWLPLSSSDRHIMTVTDTRLHNSSPTLVAKSCEFLADVLFKDFPAEIFLQRPSVFKSLLDLLEFRSDGTCVPVCAIHCLKELCCHVHARLMATSDPSLFCPDRDCWKSHVITRDISNDINQEDQYTQQRGSGDGGHGSDAVSSSSSEQGISTMDEEDDIAIEALQHCQLSVEEMCVILLAHLLEFLRGPLSSDLGAVTSVLELLYHVVDLLRIVAPDQIWTEGSQANVVMAASLSSSFKHLGEVVVHHIQHSGYQGHSTETPPTLATHRAAVMGLSALLIQLLHVLVPLDQACTVIPTDTVTVMWLLAMDVIWYRTHPNAHGSLLEYLEILDQNSFKTYIHCRDVCESFQSACKLLKIINSELSSNAAAKLTLVEQSMPGLAYHKSTRLITESIRLCSKACSPDASPTIIQTAYRVTLRILAHYDKDIRLEGYKECLGVVRDSLRISHVTHPMSSVCNGILFLLDTSVMKEICCFGLYDYAQEVQSVVVDTLETLFLGRLSMSTPLWKKILDAIVHSLPYLEGFIGTHPTLDQSIIEIVVATAANNGHITADGEVLFLQPLDHLRGGLRLMLLKDPNVRTQGLAAVIGHLTSDTTKSWGQRLFQSKQSENLRDLFIVDQLTSTMNSHTAVSHPSVEKTEITKLWSIYSSKNMDWNIRKSAAEQLAIILQDPAWHPVLLDLKADEATLEMLLGILENCACTHTPTTPSPSMDIVPPCLKILRLLAEYSWSCRGSLARKSSMYTVVVMCAVVCRHSVQVNYEAACLLTLLLFNEVAPCDGVKNSLFTLPSSLIKRYHLPFNPQVHEPISDHQYPVPQDPDPLKSYPALSMLRFSWNLAWHESLDQLCSIEGIDETSPPTKSEVYCKDLVWRSVDHQILCCSHTQWWLTENLSNINKATWHYPAKIAMNRLYAAIVIDIDQSSRETKTAVETLYTLHWQEVLERYLLVLPNSTEDDELLIEVLQILSSMLTSPSPPPISVVAWITRITVQSDSPLVSLLRSSMVHSGNGSSKDVIESRRTLRKTILQFYGHLVNHLLGSTQPWRCNGERVLIGEIAHSVTLNLDLADNPSYYDLPVLETALECLSHVTSRNQWSVQSKSQDPLGLCTNMLTSLIQVVAAFHAGRLGSTTSFMGKGVTYHASLCLVHLVHEMKTIGPTTSWLSPWINRDDSDSQTLAWLITLWSDLSPEIRWMGLSIATTLASTVDGHISLIQALQGVVGGVIGVGFSLMLDDRECGMVRTQATLLLCQLVGNIIPGKANNENKKSLPDISTLRSLLEHFKLFSRIHSILSSFSTGKLSFKVISSRACQSSASVSVSTTSSFIPYQHIPSSSQSISLVSDTAHNASQIQSPLPNGTSSPGEQSMATLSNGSVLSSNASGHTQESHLANSLVPLLNERGLPSGMSTSTSSSNMPSVAGSFTSQGTSLMSSLTPAYVGALAQLFQTLVTVDGSHTITAIKQANILNIFWSHLDSSELQAFLQAQKASAEPLSCAAVVVVRDVLQMYTRLVQLTHVLAHVDHTLLFDLQQSVFTMHKIVGLFAVNTLDLDDSLTNHCQLLWQSISTFLITLLQSQGPVTVSSVTEEMIYKHWSSFTEVFKTVTTDARSSSILRNVLLKLLGLILACDGKRQKRKKMSRQTNSELKNSSQLTEILDKDTGTSSSTTGLNSNQTTHQTDEKCAQTRQSSGSVLCSSLLGCYDRFKLNLNSKTTKEKALVKICTSGLLALSWTAKQVAQNEGLVETTIEHIKHLHVQLNLESLQLGKEPTWKKKENPIIEEINSDLNLLENFIHKYNDGKIVCLECKIIDVLHKLWSWCSVEVSLRLGIISFLCTLTAKCPKASISIGGDGSSSRASQSGSTFLNSLLKSTALSSNKVLSSQICHDLDMQLATFKALAGLLSNLVLTGECRGIIWKSNFLQQFSKLKPLKPSQGRPRNIHRIVGLSWLSILVNLTFFTDGQQMMMKIPGCVSILMEFCRVTQGKHATSYTALLVLRNLCFHGSSKSVLLANDALVNHLISNIDNPSSYTSAIAASAMWSLLHNNQKAKVTLKNSGLQNKLEELKIKFDKAPLVQDEKYWKLYTQALDNLSMVL